MIKINNLQITQGDFTLNEINLEVLPGEYAILMGASGSGKTTIMEAICGLRDIHEGSIQIAKRDVTSLAPNLRRIGYVAQDNTLFPGMKIGDQIAFPQILKKTPTAQIRLNVETLAAQLNINHILERLPENLSGGEKQRATIARALAMEPEALCFDEPLSALDEDLHQELSELLRNIVKERNLACLHITHNRREAIAIADKTYRLDRGTIKLCDL
jgi:molybdate/tungstate transport system ATP-binding protein